jgi:hypothetical protein
MLEVTRHRQPPDARAAGHAPDGTEVLDQQLADSALRAGGGVDPRQPVKVDQRVGLAALLHHRGDLKQQRRLAAADRSGQHNRPYW